MDTEFKGIFPYLISPINEKGEVIEQELIRLVNHLIDCGVHGITPLGSTGEFFYLSWEQKRRIVEIVVEAVDHRIPVVVGVACSSTAEAVWQAKEFQKIGADGILGILNVYFPLPQDSIYQYFKDLANAIELPVVVYNNPKFSGFEITPDTLLRLSEVKNINYYKDASFNTGKLLSIINRVGSNLKIFSASAHIPVFVMQMGGVGWMAGPACLIPRESVLLYNLCCEKKWDEAMHLQKKLWAVNTIFQKYNLAACIKAGLQLQGFMVGNPIPPNCPLDLLAIKDIQQVLNEIKE